MQQQLFPAAFQGAGHQAILRLDRRVLSEGAVGFLTGALQAHLPVLVEGRTFTGAGLSGLEVLRTTKETPGLDGIPVVLMSSVPPGVKQRDYGWDAFLRKPFGLEDLLRTVSEFAGRPAGR